MNANVNLQVVSAVMQNMRKRATCVEPTEFRQWVYLSHRIRMFSLLCT